MQQLALMLLMSGALVMKRTVTVQEDQSKAVLAFYLTINPTLLTRWGASVMIVGMCYGLQNI